ncbi:MAG: hypothetical protein KAW12_13525 [Candidatus Aminicenantes bacterium]|nr:hypothetical protein [Candidatus Aminicenantes bacterium]
MFKKNEIKNYIDVEILIQASHSSAKRVRLILIIMVTASVLALGSLWNSLDFGWKQRRIKRISYLAENLDRLDLIFKEYLVKMMDSNGVIEINNNNNEKKKGRITAKNLEEITESDIKFVELRNNKVSEISNLKLDTISRNDIEKMSMKFCNKKRLEGLDINELLFNAYHGIKKIISFKIKLTKGDRLLIERFRPQIFEKIGLRELCIRTEAENKDYLRFEIPFFNINFDINDLGIAGGLGFTLILMLLYLSLVREKENLNIAFETSQEVFKTKAKERRDFYKYLSMSQLLSITPSLGFAKTTNISRIIFLIVPAIFSSMILVNDLLTIKYAKLLDPNMNFTLFSLSLSFIFFITILIMTFKCYSRIIAIDNIWTNEDKEIRKLS